MAQQGFPKVAKKKTSDCFAPGLYQGQSILGRPWILPSFPECSALVLLLRDSLSQLFMPSNLEIINSKFRSHCWQLIRDSPLQSFIICDFPSHIQNPKSIFKIFGLDDFAHFLSSVTSVTGVNIYVITQQFSLLAKLFDSSHSITIPFYLFTRTNFSIPWKLNSLNCTTFYHPLPGKRLLTFTLLLISKFPYEGKKDPYQNNLMFFNYTFSPSSESSELSAPIINSPVTGNLFIPLTSKILLIYLRTLPVLQYHILTQMIFKHRWNH